MTEDDVILYGSVLERVVDPCATAPILASLIARGGGTKIECGNAGLEPELVDVLVRRRDDPQLVSEHCLAGAGWVIGCRRASESGQKWHPVISSRGVFVPRGGTRRSTADTFASLLDEARYRVRLAAPFVDDEAVAILQPRLRAALGRGAAVEVFAIGARQGDVNALRRLVEGSPIGGKSARVVELRESAPWAHLKVLTADRVRAYVGSANLTGAALTGRNFELGVLVEGPEVEAIDDMLDGLRR